MDYMQDIAKPIKSFQKLFLNPNIRFSLISKPGELTSFFPLDMILYAAQNVSTQWSFLNSTITTIEYLYLNFMKGQRRKPGVTVVPVVNLLLDFTPHLLDTDINQNDGRLSMEKQQIEELRQKYIQNPPEGMTAKLVKNMSDSDLLDMHYFLNEDDDLDDGEFEEGFYIDLF